MICSAQNALLFHHVQDLPFNHMQLVDYMQLT